MHVGPHPEGESAEGEARNAELRHLCDLDDGHPDADDGDGDGEHVGQQQQQQDEIAMLRQRIVSLSAELNDARAADRALRQTVRSATRLHEVTTALSTAKTTAQIIDVVLDVGLASIGSKSGSIFLLTSDGRSLERARSVGYEHAEEVGPLARISLAAHLPLTTAVRERRPVFESHGDSLLASLPIIVGDRCVGAVAVSFPAGEALADEEQTYLVALVHQCALALDRARLLESEHDARMRAEHADRKKDEFLAMLGHELRNPLAPILTAVELMQRRGDGGREERIIRRQVDYLVRLVDDLLDVSRITRGKVQLKREIVDVSAILVEAIEMASPLCERRKHSLDVDELDETLLVHADAARLAQVFANVLTNAAKYTDVGGNVRVRLRRERDDVIVSVKDNGSGVPADVLPRIFELFVQGERTLDRSQGGLGLGLALAKSFVVAHHGTIDAYSEGLGHGTEVVVRLPLAHKQSIEAFDTIEDQRPSSAGARGLRVLIVDDNVDAADMLAEALRDVGHEVAVAYDGPHALDVALRFSPEAALLDIGLPVMDGYELARRLRAQHSTLRCLVAVSGYGQDRDKASARDAGFDLHLVKPIDLQALLQALVDDVPAD